MTKKEKNVNKEKENKIHFSRTKKFYNTYKKTFWIILVILTIIILTLGTKIILYVNLMLGNDILLTLSTEKQDFSIKNGETQNITFLAKVKTNPFCKATCVSKFEDLSKNITLKQDEFTITPQKPLKMDHILEANVYGGGQKLYRETLECKSIETAICHTLGDYTTRSILITLNHELNDNEKISKNTLNKTLNELKEDIESSLSVSKSINKTFENKSINLNDINNIIKKNTEIQDKLFLENQKLTNLNKIWENEDYVHLENEIKNFKTVIETKSELIDLYTRLNMILIEEEKLNNEYKNLNNNLPIISKFKFENDLTLSIIEKNILDYYLVKKEFELSTNLTLKNQSINKMKRIIDDTLSFENDKSLFEIEKRKDETINTYETLCALGAECVNTDFISSISTIEHACDEISNINNFFITINKSFTSANGSLQFSNKGKGKSSLTQNETSELYTFIQTPLIECNLKMPNITLEKTINYGKIIISNITDFKINLSFNEQKDKCCINGKCFVCCEKETCQDKNYPVLFIHGHSFNKRLESDYSLDAFNKIQDKLENEGYINAGAISMYSQEIGSSEVWEEIPKPLSIKVSYYYDIFKTQEDYVLIQTKSENIDTYALRLNDLINEILKKTGKQKVTIISHSMGGLVTRRYIQIFGGEKIDKFIMIATPNQGVTGVIADYCTLVGEKQECKDLQSDSLFLNKLNRDKIPDSVKSYVIYGSGCDTDGKDGDGVVTVDSAKIDYVNNIQIKGNCSGINTLHTDLLNINKYPQVYKEISKIVS